MKQFACKPSSRPQALLSEAKKLSECDVRCEALARPTRYIEKLTVRSHSWAELGADMHKSAALA